MSVLGHLGGSAWWRCAEAAPLRCRRMVPPPPRKPPMSVRSLTDGNNVIAQNRGIRSCWRTNTTCLFSQWKWIRLRTPFGHVALRCAGATMGKKPAEWIELNHGSSYAKDEALTPELV